MGRQKTTEDFIIDAKNVHGDRYNYSNTIYINAKTKTRINCEKHGEFLITPNNHLFKKGCPSCANKGLRPSDFIEKFKIKHENRYLYLKTIYEKSNKKVIITCKKHGDFSQTPNDHLNGSGCPKCGRNIQGQKRTSTAQTFKESSIKVHGNRYDYSKTNYAKALVKITITCRLHGDFDQTPNKHLGGNGCPKCDLVRKQSNPTGWTHTNWQKVAERSTNFDSYKVYILECMDNFTGEHFFKIGKTYRKINKRFESKKLLPYKYTIHKTYYFKLAKDCSKFEKALQNKNKENKYLPKLKFGGMHECFSKIK